ncbi:MAG TPA: zinc-binding dehydrogenase [Gemmatimonadaceae bacterium]|nr:zinc-binding dehydrogenase [Gemmatimonadaceae bacterium]
MIPAPHEAVRFDSFAAPVLEPGAALLHTLCSEVCGTDVHLRHGRLAGVPYPLIPGHVAVGAIARLRGRITDVDGAPFREGDVVTFLDVHETCGQCWYCLVARESTRCPRRKVYGITYGAGDGLLGGWSEAIWMKPGVRMLRLPPGLAPEAFIGGGCGLVTALHAVDRAEIRLGQSVAVLGVGPVGQSAIALAALSGAGEIIAIGGPSDRLAFARRMGATLLVDLATPSNARADLVRERTGGRGADVVIECAGAPAAVAQALDLVRDGGRVVVVGQYTNNGPVSINPHTQINRKHVEIRGCWGSDFSHFHRALELVERFGGRVPWRAMMGEVFPLDRADDALRSVEEQRVLKAIIRPND